MVSNGPIRILVHVLYMSTYREQHILQDLSESIATSVQAFPQAHHLIMGDWQQLASETPLGSHLLRSGSLSHESLSGAQPTNFPHRVTKS